MKVINYRVFVAAISLHQKYEQEIRALYLFLRSSDIYNEPALINLFPYAVQFSDNSWSINFANGKLTFTGKISYKAKTVISVNISNTP